MLLWILFVVSAIIYYVKAHKPLQFWKERNVPYVKPWPIFGNMASTVFRLLAFPEHLDYLYNQASTRYIGFYQFLQPTLMLKDIDLLKQIAIKDYDNFLDHRSFIDEDVDPLFGKNLFSLKGNKWRYMRSTLSPAFTSSKMRSMFVLISDSAEQFANYFYKNAEQSKPIEVEMKDMFTRFANDVIATTAFGIKCDSLEERENEFYRMGARATDFTGVKGLKFFGYSLSPFLMKLFSVKIIDTDASEFFRNLVWSTIRAREKQGIVRPDMINLLMEARKGHLKYEESVKSKDEDTGFATVEESNVGKIKNESFELTEDLITAQAVLFFLAGFDTISTLLCHMANELAVHPDIQKKLQDEVDDTLKSCNGKITYDSITKMKYMDMVVCESLRKWPPSIITDRLCTKTYTIQSTEPNEPDLKLYKGDLIWVPIWSIQRDPNNFPDPERFDPERFSDENKDNIKPMTYIPFGLGPRNCIGSRFALLEAKVVFLHLLSKFNFVVTGKTQVPLKLKKSAFNLMAEKGFWLGLKPRNK